MTTIPPYRHELRHVVKPLADAFTAKRERAFHRRFSDILDELERLITEDAWDLNSLEEQYCEVVTKCRESPRDVMVCDFGTPSHYYCIVKEVIDRDEVVNRVSNGSLLQETETAGITKQRRPGEGVVSDPNTNSESSDDRSDSQAKTEDESEDDIREELEEEFSDLLQ